MDSTPDKHLSLSGLRKEENMDAEFAIALKESVKELKDAKLNMLLDAIEKAVFELREGNSKDGDWERVRRGIFILENEVRWIKEYSI